MSRKLPPRVVSSIVAAAVVCPLAVYVALRISRPAVSPPPELVISACRDLPPGVHRIGFDIMFYVPGMEFTIRTVRGDTPPSIEYYVATTNRGATRSLLHMLEISVWGLAFERQLEFAWPVFSEHVEERNVPTAQGGVAGTDRWGYLKTGERWRFIRFGRTEEVGYLPVPDREAKLFDDIISSACFPATPTGRQNATHP